MAPTEKKGMKISRALRSAARLPARVAGNKWIGRNDLTPLPGEVPVVLLKLQVIGCKDLLAKDRNGSSDPYVVVSLLNTRFHTPVFKRNTNPVYQAKDATFEFPIHVSLADRLGHLELVVWDKDLIMKKDYLGEVSLPLDKWFGDGRAFSFDDPGNTPFSIDLVSTRARTNVTGSVQIKLGFVAAASQPAYKFADIFSDLTRRSRPSLVSAPPTEGIGTIRSHQHGPEFEDDGGISSEDECDDHDATDDEEEAAIPTPPTVEPEIQQPQPQIPVIPPTPSTPTTPTMPFHLKMPSAPRLSSSGFIPKILPRRTHSGTVTPTSVSDSSITQSLSSSTTLRSRTPDQKTAKKAKFSKAWLRKNSDYNFNAGNDIMGIVMLEIQGAIDLPRLKNMTRTGWDMDPFVVISFSKKVFRTRVIRHSLNPIWEEKLLFHVRQYEANFNVQLHVLDWDKLSSNDHIGDASFNVSELLADAPQPDPITKLYPADEEDHPMKEFNLSLSNAREMAWETKHSPVLTFRAKYQSYAALRQRFWRQYLKQYDTDDTGTLSHLELSSMLDSLGSTLSRRTVNSFFTRHGKSQEEELTIEAAIQSLETELCRPNSERRRLDAPDDPSPAGTNMPPTPLVTGEEHRDPLMLTELDFSGMSLLPGASEQPLKARPPMPHPTEPMQQPLVAAALSADPSSSLIAIGVDRQSSISSSESDDQAGTATEDSFERVINVKNCPLCHRPRFNSKAEMDIVTHLAVCASSDWARVDRIVVGNFVTANQAQRKWYTKVLSKVSSGDYRLGANSANIIVQNRMTGQLEEEKMQAYVRLGIRLLYKGAKGRMEGSRARRLLKSLSIKQGIKYDDPASARDIPAFIEFHNLDVDDILDPLDSFKTFNQFFYRKLKPSARPVEDANNPYRLVSGADCRLMVFESVSEAMRLWIKGRDFTVKRLLGDAYQSEAEQYIGGALAIFRLAPQDYHRFHSPVDGTIGHITDISGEYYTVNPQAIRTSLDVYGENVRKIVPISSPQFGRVMFVCVGAMMVGSIQTTVKEGDEVKRGQEVGYFSFGGSTIVLLFEKSVQIEWDEDLLINGRASLETLVRVGMGIGHRRGVSGGL